MLLSLSYKNNSLTLTEVTWMIYIQTSTKGNICCGLSSLAFIYGNSPWTIYLEYLLFFFSLELHMATWILFFWATQMQIEEQNHDLYWCFCDGAFQTDSSCIWCSKSHAILHLFTDMQEEFNCRNDNLCIYFLQ